VRACDAGVGEEDVEAAVPLDGVVDHLLDRLLVGRVKLPRVDVHLGPQSVDLALVRLEVGAIVVADVDGLGAVLGELQSGCAADSEDGVGALIRSIPRHSSVFGLEGSNTSDDDHFVGNPRPAGGDLKHGREAAAGELVAEGLDSPLCCLRHCAQFTACV
jgi:hypothetical protein